MLGLAWDWSSITGVREGIRFVVPAVSLFLAVIVQEDKREKEKSEWAWFRWIFLLGNIAVFSDWFIAGAYLLTECDWGGYC